MEPRNAPILLNSIQEILLTVLYTGAVEGAVPVSVIMVAQSGTGKSKLLKCYNGPSVHQTDSFSSQGLYQLMAGDRDNKIRFIVTQDMNPTLSRRQSTVIATMANLLSLTMDGTCRVDDGRENKLCEHKPIGLISAVTPDMYQRQTKRWFSLGLRRRIIPIFFDYTMLTIEQIKKAVREDKVTGSDFPSIKVNILQQHSPVISDVIAMQLEAFGTKLSQNLGLQRFKNTEGKIQWAVRNIVPISPIIVLRTLAKAHAIMEKRGTVNEQDMEFIAYFVDCTNESAPKQI